MIATKSFLTDATGADGRSAWRRERTKAASAKNDAAQRTNQRIGERRVEKGLIKSAKRTKELASKAEGTADRIR
jgi:hypothetical protein